MSRPELSPTVYGIETEYTSNLTLPDDGTFELVGVCHDKLREEGFDLPVTDTSHSLDDDDIANAIDETGVAAHDGFLINGGIFYIDVSGFEYGTAETRTAEEAVYRSFDGDQFVLSVLVKLQQADKIKSFQLNRRSADHLGLARGTHINTAVSSDTVLFADNMATIDAMSTLNVAKGAMFGSGGLMLDEQGETHFYHSPRLALTDTDIAVGSHDVRPLYRNGIKPDVGCNRLESVAGDALNFAWPMRASMVMTDAVAKLAELRRIENIPILCAPIWEARKVGRFGCKATVDLVNMNDLEIFQMTSLQLLRHIAEVSLGVDETEDIFNAETRQVLGEIVSMADVMEQDMYAVASQVESVARLKAMQRRMRTAKVGVDSEKLCRFDYYWDKVGGGAAEQLRESGKAGWLGFSSQHSVVDRQRRLRMPPKDTRAVIRSEVVVAGAAYKIDWPEISIEEGMTIALHPLQTNLTYNKQPALAASEKET